MNERYKQYLRSDDWRQKRQTKLGRKGGKLKRCAICAATEHLDIHHLRYEKDLTHVQQFDLRILCRTCHEIAHDLMRRGLLKFKSENHHHRFTLTKLRVKQKREMLHRKNVFVKPPLKIAPVYDDPVPF